MIKMSEGRCELRTPCKKAIGLAKAAGLDPAVIAELPKHADLNTGTGIPDGALVLSRSHLKYMGFPLHPLFQFVWSALNLHPMQLSPNSYLQLSAFLAFGLQEGVCIYPSDFFHFHDCVPTQDKGDYFHFTSKTSCKFFVKKPSSHKNWKRQPLLITRNWAAPELKFLKIRSTFATSAVKFTPSPNPERIQFLKACFARNCSDIENYPTPTILVQISRERSSIIYSHFQPLRHLKPKPGSEEVATRIVDSLASMDAGVSACLDHVTKWESMRKRVEKRNESGETDEAVHSFDIADVDQVEPVVARQPPPLPYSLPSPSKLGKKRSGSSALPVKKRLKPVLDPSAQSSRTCLEPIPPPTFSSLKSIPLNKKKNVALEKDDGTYVTEEEEAVRNRGACFAVFQNSFHAADASALPKKAPQEITEDTTCFSELQQIFTAIVQREKQLNADSEKQKQRILELESQVRTEQELHKKVQCSLSALQKLRNEKRASDLKFENAENSILKELTRLLKFKKIVANPDVLDAGHRLKPGDYESCDGMKPSEEDEVEQHEEDDLEDEDDQDEENDQEEDDTKDEDDQDEEDDPEDEGEQDGNDDHDQCCLAGRDVDNNLNLFMHTSQLENSPNRNHLPLQSNQETSDTALLFHSEPRTYQSSEHVPGFSHMGGVKFGYTARLEGGTDQNQNEFEYTALLEGGANQYQNEFEYTALLEGGANQNQNEFEYTALLEGGSNQNQNEFEYTALLEGGSNQNHNEFEYTALFEGGANQNQNEFEYTALLEGGSSASRSQNQPQPFNFGLI